MNESEISLNKKLFILWRDRHFIIILSIFFGLLCLAYALYIPDKFKAECYFLPDDFKNGRIMLEIMKKNSVLDMIIDKFSLMKVYRQKQRSKMRELILNKILETHEDAKTGIISAAIIDENPKRAAAMANSFVEALQKKILDISLNEAVQRKNFFKERLNKARNELQQAEEEMLNYQEKSENTISESELQERLNSIKGIQRQIAVKRVEISALSNYARPDSPVLKLANSQLEALNAQLERLEQKNTTPNLSAEYQSYALNLEIATKNYEAVLKQYEASQLNEVQGFLPLQILDYATEPDTKYKPDRIMIVISGTFSGFILSCLIAVLRNHIKSLKKNVSSSKNERKIKLELSGKFLEIILSYAPAMLILLAIIFLTLQPHPDSGEFSRKFQTIVISFLGRDNTPAWILNMSVLRALAHVPMYFALGLAVFSAMLFQKINWFRAFLITLLICATLGLADEALKLFLPGREFDVIDWSFDIIGSLAGIIFVLALKVFIRLIHRYI